MDLKISIMPVRESGRRRRHDEDEPRSARKKERKQGWGAVAQRQAEVAENREKSENAVRDFWLKPVKPLLSSSYKTNRIATMRTA